MTLRVTVCVLLVSLNGCAGPHFLRVLRYKYNETTQKSTDQQLPRVFPNGVLVMSRRSLPGSHAGQVDRLPKVRPHHSASGPQIY